MGHADRRIRTATQLEIDLPAVGGTGFAASRGACLACGSARFAAAGAGIAGAPGCDEVRDDRAQWIIGSAATTGGGGPVEDGCRRWLEAGDGGG